MTFEYAVQYRGVIDGPYDRTLPVDGMTGKKWTSTSAAAEAYAWNHRRTDGTVENIARAVFREVTDWQVLE